MWIGLTSKYGGNIYIKESEIEGFRDNVVYTKHHDFEVTESSITIVQALIKNKE